MRRTVMIGRQVLSVVIPVVGNKELTAECVSNLENYCGHDIEVIIVDNASPEPYKQEEFPYCTIIRNDTNIGVYPSLLQGISRAGNNIVVLMHNDVLIWELNWDGQLHSLFENNSKLGIVGLFGGRGVGLNGGRSYPESNMLGQKWGMNGRDHGALLESTHPACVFDSLFLAIRKDYFNLVNIEEMPPHHWYDRILTLLFIKAGYHALTVGIGFDHMGGGTSSDGRTTMEEFTKKWCAEKGLEVNQNPDYTMYKYGEHLFQTLFSDILPLTVDNKFNYRCNGRNIHGNTYLR